MISLHRGLVMWSIGVVFYCWEWTRCFANSLIAGNFVTNLWSQYDVHPEQYLHNNTILKPSTIHQRGLRSTLLTPYALQVYVMGFRKVKSSLAARYLLENPAIVHGYLLLITISQTTMEVWTWINNHIYINLCNVNTHPYPYNYNPKNIVLHYYLSMPWTQLNHVIKKDGVVSTYRSYGIHYNDVIMGTMAFQITSLRIVYSTVYSGADQRQDQRSASLAFVRGIHRWPVNSPHKWPVTRKMFPFDDVIMRIDRTDF